MSHVVSTCHSRTLVSKLFFIKVLLSTEIIEHTWDIMNMLSEATITDAIDQVIKTLSPSGGICSLYPNQHKMILQLFKGENIIYTGTSCFFSLPSYISLSIWKLRYINKFLLSNVSSHIFNINRILVVIFQNQGTTFI